MIYFNIFFCDHYPMLKYLKRDELPQLIQLLAGRGSSQVPTISQIWSPGPG
uniref:Uncharacterized protein n=1 Tax=Arion vulgaris TaxID=1028688 RepID=A0A0B7ARN4_9EUPU